MKPWLLPERQASTTLHDLRLIVLHAILHHNRSLLTGYRLQEDMIADQVTPRPIDLWSWGTMNRTGHLRTMDATILRLHCLPGGKATVTARGIKFGGLYYSCELAKRERWFERARNSGTWTVDVAFDPRSAKEVFLRSPDSRSVETCLLVEAEARFQESTWADVDDFMRSQKVIREEFRSEDLQASADLQAQVKNIAVQAAQQAAVSNKGLSKAAKLRGIRENRVLERSHQAGGTDAAELNEANGKPVTPMNGTVAPNNADVIEYIPPPSQIDMLRKHRDNQKRTPEC